jgi:hypothetical protein
MRLRECSALLARVMTDSSPKEPVTRPPRSPDLPRAAAPPCKDDDQCVVQEVSPSRFMEVEFVGAATQGRHREERKMGLPLLTKDHA